MPAKLTINQMREIAVTRGGECLSEVYANGHSNLRWRCAEGHEWEATGGNVKKGSWCPQCAGNQRFTIKDMQAVAAKHGGKCMSKTYVNSSQPLVWECAKGHQWSAWPRDIRSKGTWCPQCSGKAKLTIEQMRAHAEKRGGKCLSPEYINNRTNLAWRCAEGHEWNATPSNVLLADTWCPYCIGKNKTIDDMQALAAAKGGECLSSKYKTSQSKLRWRCAVGHEWIAWPNSISNGSWCPECSKLVSERVCRAHFESMFDQRFPTKRPKWLTNSRGNRMELDGYCEKMGIAFEYQGIQHYQQHERFHSGKGGFEQRAEDDQLKAKLCLQNNVQLIDVPYTIPLDDLREYIANRCQELGIRLPANWRRVEIDLTTAFSFQELQRMQEIAASHGGRLISTQYIRDDIKLKWECVKGHRFECRPTHVKRGVWCAECAGKRKNTIEDMHRLAKKRGGRFLSPKFTRLKEKHLWECSEGHRWETKPELIKRGSWCPECYEQRRRKQSN